MPTTRRWLRFSFVTLICLLFSLTSLAAPPAATTSATTTATTQPTVRTSVAQSTIERSGRHPGDPIINTPGAVRGVVYQSLTGGKPVTPQALFGRKVQPDGLEARQGHAGDCYLIATMAGYAEFHPEVVKSVFLHSTGNLRVSATGRPAARYFEHDHETGGFKEADPALYDGRAPVHEDTGKLPLAKAVDGHIWGPMVEYTYTKFRNEQGGAARSTNPNYDRAGFNRTANGGYPNHVMKALTGKSTETVYVDPRHEDEVWNKLMTAQAKNQVVVVGSTVKDELKDRVKNEVLQGHLEAEEAKGITFDGRRWVDGHAYTAWGDKDHPFVFEQNGERMIRLRNPWGDSAPGGHGEDGIGVIPFKDFVMRYDRAWVGAGSALHSGGGHSASNATTPTVSAASLN